MGRKGNEKSTWDHDRVRAICSRLEASDTLNRRLTLERVKRFEFTESGPEQPFELEPGLEGFLNDPSLSGKATEEEIAVLKSLRLRGRRPNPLYYYRELQNLRDPLHFGLSPSQQKDASKPRPKPERSSGTLRAMAAPRARRTRNKKQPA